MASAEQWTMANERARKLQRATPRVLSARYDRRIRRVVIDLSSKLTISFSPKDAQGLNHATPADLETIEVSPSGFGIHFPAIDADLYVPALLEGFLGSRRWMAARLGQSGGCATTKAKRAAARENGKLGGRPRKAARSR